MSEQRKHRTLAETASANSEPIEFESAVPKIRSVSRSDDARSSGRIREGQMRPDIYIWELYRTRDAPTPATRVHLIAIGHTFWSCVHFTCAKNS